MATNTYPKPANKLGLMLFDELTKRHEKEKQDALRLMAENDGIPLDGSVHLQAGQWVLTNTSDLKIVENNHE